MVRRLMTALAALWLLAACAAPPLPAEAGAPRPRLWYVGVALYGESWSENDVAEMATGLEQTAADFNVVPTVLSNRAGARQIHPSASRDEIERTTGLIARHAQPGDIVLVYVSTHGNPGMLARDLGGDRMEAVGPRELRAWLAPLGARPTVLVLSACFSGSLIPALRAENRVIFTAARADRSSFGCQPDATHSVFGEALLGALAPRASLHSIVDRTLAAVSRRERRMGVTASAPQVFVGGAMASLYDEPVF